VSTKYPHQKSNSPDHFQTPAVALDPLLSYLRKDWTIWEPACGKGNLTTALRDITNPPYSKKDEFLERSYQLGKPFALLLPLTVFDSIKRRKLFQQHGVECIFLPNRISFETPNHEANVAAGKKTSSWFATLWITWGLSIGKQLVFTDA
jgi:hypothetical protein